MKLITKISSILFLVFPIICNAQNDSLVSIENNSFCKSHVNVDFEFAGIGVGYNYKISKNKQLGFSIGFGRMIQFISEYGINDKRRILEFRIEIISMSFNLRIYEKVSFYHEISPGMSLDYLNDGNGIYYRLGYGMFWGKSLQLGFKVKIKHPVGAFYDSDYKLSIGSGLIILRLPL